MRGIGGYNVAREQTKPIDLCVILLTSSGFSKTQGTGSPLPNSLPTCDVPMGVRRGKPNSLD